MRISTWFKLYVVYIGTGQLRHGKGSRVSETVLVQININKIQGGLIQFINKIEIHHTFIVFGMEYQA